MSKFTSFSVPGPIILPLQWGLGCEPGAEKQRPTRAFRSLVGLLGSPRRGKSRTLGLNLTLLAGATLAARGASRFAYQFEGAELPGCFEPPTGPARSSKPHRNPIALAQEWQRALDDGECPSRAALARQLGVTRARVTQVLGLLDLAPEVVHAIAALGDPLPRPIVSERMLRALLTLPAGEQQQALAGVCPTANRASA